MSDWDADLHFAQEQQVKFFRDGAWAPYLEVRKWKRRFYAALLVIAALLAIVVRGCR